MPKLPSELRAAQNSINVYKSWQELGPKERRARTAPGRAGLDARFERQVDPDGVLTPAERAERVADAKRAYFRGLALKSADVRAQRKAEACADPETVAPVPSPAEVLAGGIEQLLTDARACGDKRIERAALKAQTAIGVVEALYGPWLAEQKAAKEREKELAAAQETAAKLRAQLEDAQAKVASLKGKPTRKTTSGKKPAGDGGRSQAIREWAKTRGIKVNERGRIPGHVVERYDREQAGGDG